MYKLAFLSLILNPKHCWTCGGKTWQAPIKPSSHPLTSWPDPTWYLLCFQFQQQWIYNVYYTYICIHMYICISGWVEWELASTVSWLLSTTEPSWRLTWLDKRSCQVSSKQPIQTKCWDVKITLEVELRFRVLAFWHPYRPRNGDLVLCLDSLDIFALALAVQGLRIRRLFCDPHDSLATKI